VRGSFLVVAFLSFFKVKVTSCEKSNNKKKENGKPEIAARENVG